MNFILICKTETIFLYSFYQNKSISPLSLTAHRHSMYSCRELSTNTPQAPCRSPSLRREVYILFNLLGIGKWTTQRRYVCCADAIYLFHKCDISEDTICCLTASHVCYSKQGWQTMHFTQQQNTAPVNAKDKSSRKTTLKIWSVCLFAHYSTGTGV